MRNHLADGISRTGLRPLNLHIVHPADEVNVGPLLFCPVVQVRKKWRPLLVIPGQYRHGIHRPVVLAAQSRKECGQRPLRLDKEAPLYSAADRKNGHIGRLQ